MLSEIDYKALENFKDMRKKTPTQYGTPRSERAVDLEMAILRHIFKKGVKWGMIENNPFENGEDLFFKTRNNRERALTEDEVKKLVDACPPYLKGIVITGIYTALRKGDILSLKWQNVDLEKGVIRLVEAKTEKTRVIVLNEDMKNSCRSFRSRESIYSRIRMESHLEISRDPSRQPLKKRGSSRVRTAGAKLYFTPCVTLALACYKRTELPQQP